MPDPSQFFPEVNRVIHEPARLAILTVLSACRSADFVFIQRTTGLTKGNLSVQISRLEEAGLVTVEKRIKKKKTLTTISLARTTRGELARYWRTLDQIREQAIAGTMSFE
jgi:DNA-binding transcriptional ArsR family regulator